MKVKDFLNTYNGKPNLTTVSITTSTGKYAVASMTDLLGTFVYFDYDIISWSISEGAGYILNIIVADKE